MATKVDLFFSWRLFQRLNGKGQGWKIDLKNKVLWVCLNLKNLKSPNLGFLGV